MSSEACRTITRLGGGGSPLWKSLSKTFECLGEVFKLNGSFCDCGNNLSTLTTSEICQAIPSLGGGGSPLWKSLSKTFECLGEVFKLNGSFCDCGNNLSTLTTSEICQAIPSLDNKSTLLNSVCYIKFIFNHIKRQNAPQKYITLRCVFYTVLQFSRG